MQLKLNEYMMNMLQNSRCFIFFLLILFNSFFYLSQDKKFDLKNWKNTEINIRKSGPYIGYQKGHFSNIEVGYEFLWKKIKLVKPVTHSLHLGMSYNLFNNVVGYEFGYYNKIGRINFTYGLNTIYYSDFIHNKIGFSPVIGYKLFGFHLQAGANIFSISPNFKTTNKLFLSLRFFILRNRDVDIKN